MKRYITFNQVGQSTICGRQSASRPHIDGANEVVQLSSIGELTTNFEKEKENEAEQHVTTTKG